MIIMKRLLLTSIILATCSVAAFRVAGQEAPVSSSTRSPERVEQQEQDAKRVDAQTYALEASQRLKQHAQEAKTLYSPIYDQKTLLAKQNLSEALRDYSRVAKSDAAARQFATQIKLDEILSLSNGSPDKFQAAIERTGAKLVSRGFAKTATEQERRVAEAVGDYLRAVKRDLKKILQESSPEERRFAEEEREYFMTNCDLFPQAFDQYLNDGNEESFYALEQILGELCYYQPESPAVYRLTSCLGEVFSSANFFFEASERFLSEISRREILMSFPVRETIREAFAQGNGVISGQTRLDLKPNNKRAEMTIDLVANVNTRTIGSSRGVHVHSDNSGSVMASKPIYLNPNWLLATSPSRASGYMKSTVRGVNTEHVALFGGAVILNKINQELPYSEQESSRRVSNRVASELDRQADVQLQTINDRVKSMFERARDPLFNNLHSHTTESRLFLVCTLGRVDQLSAPNASFAPFMHELFSRRAQESGDDANPLADTLGSYQNACPDYSEREGRPAANLWNTITANARSSRLLKREGALVKKGVDATKDSDIRIRIHQSGPNNIAAVALAGAQFGPESQIEDVIRRFQGVEPADVTDFLKPYFPKTQRELDPEDNYKEINVCFDEVRPFSARFENDSITMILRMSQLIVDGKELPPVDVHFVYRIVKRDGLFAFQREEVEVVPAGYREGDAVSARFHTIRRIFIKRLETAILDEYVVSPVPISTISPTPTDERRGALIPVNITAKEGWLEVELKFDPNYVK